MTESTQPKSIARLIGVELDQDSIAHRGADVEHERRIAIYDLLEENLFLPAGSEGGPFHLRLGIQENRLVFQISHESSEAQFTHVLSLTPLKRVIRDYFVVCDTYYQAIRLLRIIVGQRSKPALKPVALTTAKVEADH